MKTIGSPVPFHGSIESRSVLLNSLPEKVRGFLVGTLGVLSQNLVGFGCISQGLFYILNTLLDTAF